MPNLYLLLCPVFLHTPHIFGYQPPPAASGVFRQCCTQVCMQKIRWCGSREGWLTSGTLIALVRVRCYLLCTMLQTHSHTACFVLQANKGVHQLSCRLSQVLSESGDVPENTTSKTAARVRSKGKRRSSVTRNVTYCVMSCRIAPSRLVPSSPRPLGSLVPLWGRPSSPSFFFYPLYQLPMCTVE